jgi:hypothetical protein
MGLQRFWDVIVLGGLAYARTFALVEQPSSPPPALLIPVKDFLDVPSMLR